MQSTTPVSEAVTPDDESQEPATPAEPVGTTSFWDILMRALGVFES